MRRLLFTLALTLFVTMLSGQSVRPLFNTPAPGIVHIAGTNVSLIPPAGFQVSSKFRGLQNGKSIIEIYDLPGGSFKKMVNDFSTEKFEKQGLTVFSEKHVVVGGDDGRILFVQKGSAEKSISLIFGNERYAVIVVASYPPTDEVLQASIEEALMSINYGGFPTASALEEAYFKLDDSRSPFRYHKYAANTYYYTTSGGNPIREKDSYLTVTQLAWDYSTSPATIAKLMVKEMNKYGIKDTVVKKESSKKLNGHPAYESEIYATRKGARCTIYQMVVVHDDRAVVIHGIDTGNLKGSKSEFRKLAHTLKFK